MPGGRIECATSAAAPEMTMQPLKTNRAVFLAAALSLLLGTAVPGTPSTQATDADARQVSDLNSRILRALIVDNDARLFLQHADAAFLVVAPGGRVEDKTQSAAGAQSFDAVGITISGERVAMHADTAVVVGRLDIDGVMAPVGKLGPMKFMAVFVRDKGHWSLLSRSLTPCMEIAVKHGFC